MSTRESRSRARADSRLQTPEPGPLAHGPYDAKKMTKGWRGEWRRHWRHIAFGLEDDDVCQLCCGVGHQAVDCELFKDRQKTLQVREEERAQVTIEQLRQQGRLELGHRYTQILGFVMFLVGLMVGMHHLFGHFITPPIITSLVLMIGGLFLEYRRSITKLVSDHFRSSESKDTGGVADED
ncbi:hypothetical protein HBI56_207440 [Parastagonospora nodorum]|nr:hypothetical protein HBI10_224490 [Parastagonospora nodorum]KAH4009785.1 hypothetical protein HBI13_214950 [Parastagonospora nodorum]KAH4155395.1 hypothetical protein HBH43_211880 [Parastagonospora nodorum]KAH4216748.1 hypothetical protein HBI06_225850 [Parastagonospora nodorum]KAH4228606.1 hypothetical protein HBI05_203920 [Parastagonospora nodorum]